LIELYEFRSFEVSIHFFVMFMLIQCHWDRDDLWNDIKL